MAYRRDRRRIGAASVTLSAGALVFFAVGTTPASASTSQTTSECELGKLLCGVLGTGSGTATSPPPQTSGGGGTIPKPTGRPAPAPKPKPAARPPASPTAGHAPAHHHPTGGASPARPAGDTASIPIPDSVQTPALPDVTGQDPLVLPEAPPGGEPARLAGESERPDHETVPPLLVATASGLIGAVGAFNLSVLRRRRG